MQVIRLGLLMTAALSALALGSDLVARTAQASGGVATVLWAQASDPIAVSNPTTILAGFLLMAAGSFSALLWQLKKKDDQIDRLSVLLQQCQQSCGHKMRESGGNLHADH